MGWFGHLHRVLLRGQLSRLELCARNADCGNRFGLRCSLLLPYGRSPRSLDREARSSSSAAPSAPGTAFTLTFFEAVAFCFLAAINAYFMVQVGIAPLFAMLSILTGTDFTSVTTWLTSHTGTFVVGGVILLITGLIPVFGMRRLLLLNRIMFVVAVVGIAVGFLVLLFKTQTGFDHAFTQATGLTRGKVISAAQHSGIKTAGFSWSQR